MKPHPRIRKAVMLVWWITGGALGAAAVLGAIDILASGLPPPLLKLLWLSLLAAGSLVPVGIIGIAVGVAMQCRAQPKPPDLTLCQQCGYSLRGLPAGAACPECGSTPA